MNKFETDFDIMYPARITGGLQNTKEKRYDTEVVMITNSNNAYHIFHFLQWYIDILRFDHARIILNNKKLADCIQSVHEKYNKKVELIEIYHQVAQSDVYNDLLLTSEAKWCFYADDDEYLYISNAYSNCIKNVIAMYGNGVSKISFPWVYMRSSEPLDASDDSVSMVETYRYCLKTYQPRYRSNVKTMLNTDYPHVWVEQRYDEGYVKKHLGDIGLDGAFTGSNDFEKMGSVHNPITIMNGEYLHAVTPSSDMPVFGMRAVINMVPDDLYVMHFKYRSRNEYTEKIGLGRFTDYNYSYENSVMRAEAFERFYNETDVVLKDEGYQLLRKIC